MIFHSWMAIKFFRYPKIQMNIKKTPIFFSFLFIAFASFAQTFPERPNRLVNDYTSTLSADEISRLEQKLTAFDDSTSTQIAVVIIKSLEGYDVADYGARLAETWGIGNVGKDKKNNGVLLLASLGDRRVTIQTGYGVEGALPDAIARRIIENEVTPNFKNGNYFAGLNEGTDAIISYTKGEYTNENPKRKGGSRGGYGFIFIIIIFIIIAIISRRGGGGGSQVIGGRGGASPFWWMLMGAGLGRGSSGGGWGGFSGGGGSGGGGGFGGFGGGSFGGGGASGSW